MHRKSKPKINRMVAKKSRYTNNYNKWKQKKAESSGFSLGKPCHSSPVLSFYSVLSPKSMSLDTAACLQVPVIDL